MTYGELKQYIGQLQTSGYHAVPYMVQLQRKVAFPFATVIMALLAVPFAVTTGRRGAMYGIGFGIALSIGYWVILNVFSAMGEGGVLTPTLAAWAPNLLFGIAALYTIEFGDTVMASLAFYMFGEDAAGTVAREKPRWQSWIQRQFPAPTGA